MSGFESQLRVLVRFFSSQKIKYVVLGGVAVSVYGEPRLTGDIDVNILLGQNRIPELLKKFKKHGLSPVLARSKKIARETGVIPLRFTRGGFPGRADIIIAQNVLEFNAIKRSRLRKINGMQVKLISPEDLIIHKIASQRSRDFEDLKGILIRQKGKLDKKYIRYWLKKIDRANRKSRLLILFNKLLKELQAKSFS